MEILAQKDTHKTSCEKLDKNKSRAMCRGNIIISSVM